jgi:hypothetical protein
MGRRLVVALWVLVVAAAAGIAVASVRADAKPACTHGASSIGPVTIANGKVVGGSTVPHTQACLP